MLRSQSFDWLCEQGHVGLERVAKARRDPALVAPVTAALERARGDLRAPQGRRLGAARVAREPAAAGRSRARAHRNGDRGRRAAALHLVPPAPRSTSIPPTRRWLRPRRATGSCAARGARPPTRSSRGLPAKGFGFGGVQRERAYHDALRDLGDAGDGPSAASCGSPPLDGDGAAAYAATATRCCALRLLSRADARLRLVGDGDVDRLAAPAADAHLLRHVGRRPSTRRARCRTARRRSRRGRCRGTRAGRRPPGSRCRRRAAPRPRGSAASRWSPWRSERAELAGEVRDQRVEHAGDDALAHRRGLAGDLRVGVDRAAAVVELRT